MKVARAKKAKPPLESAVSKAIREYLDYRRDVVVWRSNTGAARLPAKGGKTRPVFFGLKGSADFSGIIPPYGVRLEIEIKRPEIGAQTVDQRCFGARIKAAGGVYFVTTGVDDCKAKLDDALSELRERFVGGES